MNLNLHRRPHRRNLLWAVLALTVGCGGAGTSSQTFDVTKPIAGSPAGKQMAVVWVSNVGTAGSGPALTLTIDGKTLRNCAFADCVFPPAGTGGAVALYIPNGGKYTLGVEGTDLALPLDLTPCSDTSVWIYGPHDKLQAQSWLVPTKTDAPAGMESQRFLQLMDPDKPVIVEGVAADGTESQLASLDYGVPVWVTHAPKMNYYLPGRFEGRSSLDEGYLGPTTTPVGEVFESPTSTGWVDYPGEWTFGAGWCGY